MNTSSIRNATIPKIEEKLILDRGILEGDKVGWFKRKIIPYLTVIFIAGDHKDNKTYPGSGQRFIR